MATAATTVQASGVTEPNAASAEKMQMATTRPPMLKMSVPKDWTPTRLSSAQKLAQRERHAVRGDASEAKDDANAVSAATQALKMQAPLKLS